MPTHIICETCGKPAVEAKRSKIGITFIVELRCGHKIFTQQLEPIKPDDDLTSFVTRHKPFEFQKYTLEFILASGGRTGIFHEQGLGKTICALLALRQSPKMLPALVVCKSNIAFQWFRQSFDWLGDDILVQMIRTGKDFILPGCQIYITSYDLLSKFKDAQLETLDTCQTLILDEVQHIKNPETQRTKHIRALAHGKKYLLALSGTPIKNHAGEYFTILNLLHPERFPSDAYYEHRYVDSYWDGYAYKRGGLKNEQEFRNQTDDFIIRFEQKEVLPDLPDLIRDFQYFDIDTDLRKAYEKAEEELSEFIEGEGERAFGFASYQHVLALLSKLRQITALSKVETVADEVLDTLEQTEGKVIVFLHHHLARTSLMNRLKNQCLAAGFDGPLAITEEHSRDKKEEIKQEFISNPNKRILVLGTLASGEGVDGLQDVCSKLIIMERQWNPANEEQAEKRLHRIGQKSTVRAVYPIAIGTCDEMYTQLIEKKRQNVKQTYGDEEVIPWNETSTVRDLVMAITEKRGGRVWKLA